ncbi:MAG: hypothetical protein DDT19_01934 [Syntrophomonadaceae bacterium]|nr:hypothetical protein [Bacillota bacterium]
MRKESAVLYVDCRAVSFTPHSSDKISKAVHRNHSSLIKGRNKKGTSQMRDMVLNIVELRLELRGLGAEFHLKYSLYVCNPRRVPDPV